MSNTLSINTNEHSNLTAPPPLAPPQAITLSFSGATLSGFAKFLVCIFATLLIIPAAWGAVYFYQWAVANVKLSNGTLVRFTGKAKDAWLLFAVYAFTSQLPNIIAFFAKNNPKLLPISNILPLVLIPLQAYLVIEIMRWVFKHIQTSTGTKMTFKGSTLGYLGWTLLIILSFVTIIGWAWVSVAFTNWICRNIESEGHQFAFTGTGLEVLWRSIATILGCCLIIPMPWVLMWYARWMLSCFVINKG